MNGALPETRDTLVAALASSGDEDRHRALDLIARAYRAPVVALLARRWRLEPADAEDLAQEFLARAVEKGWFTRYDPARGRFRAFLRACVEDFARTVHRDASRLRRGGGATHLGLDAASGDAGRDDAPAAGMPGRGVSEPALASDPDVDRLFEREWARSVLTIACDRLRAECEGTARAVAWRLFERYDLRDVPDDARPTYAMLAAESGEPVTQVTNHLAWARRRMREHVLATLRLLTGDEREYRDEVRALLGIDA